jgi:hypothetical protein
MSNRIKAALWLGGVLVTLAAAAAAASSAFHGAARAKQPNQYLHVLFSPAQRAARSVFDLQGFEYAPRHFRVSGRLYKLPCRGRYQALSVGTYGSTTVRYRAAIRIRATSSSVRHHHCGRGLPRTVGRRIASFTIRRAFRKTHGYPRIPLRVTVRRQKSGRFTGTIYVATFLCVGPFRLVAKLSDGPRIRTYRYRFVVTRARLANKPVRKCNQF